MEIKVSKNITIDTDNLRTVHKLAASGLLAVVIMGLGIWQLSYPKYEQLQTLNTEIEQQEISIQDKQNKVRNLVKLKEELKQIEARLVNLRRKIPQQPNLAPLLIDIEEITENKELFGNNATLNEFRPGGIVNFDLPAELQDAKESTVAKQLKQIPISIHLSNISYPDFIKLLTDYESYERTLSVESISLIPADQKDALYTPVNVTFTLKAFLLAGE
jgi:Tfp pilus assembly protein PilO